MRQIPLLNRFDLPTFRPYAGLLQMGGLASSIDYELGYDDHLLDYVTYGGMTLDYSYDTVDQLTTVDYTGTGTPADEAYSLDDSGNRTNTGYTTGDHNRLTSDGTYNYQYDAAGNRTLRTKISDGTKTEYGWDHRNRLTSVTFKTAANVVTKTVEYEYDAFNRLVHKEVDADGAGAGTATDAFWVYDGSQAVLEFDGDAATDLSHRYLRGPAVDQLLADETVDDGGAEDVLWPLTDWQGSVRHLAEYDASTNATTIENEKFYDAYGNVKSESNSAVDTIFGYTGRFFDDDTGLQWNLNRWYDPGVGRWLSEDPIGFGGGDANLYRYVGNGPVSKVDPSGLDGAGIGAALAMNKDYQAAHQFKFADPAEVPRHKISYWPARRGFSTCRAVYQRRKKVPDTFFHLQGPLVFNGRILHNWGRIPQP